MASRFGGGLNHGNSTMWRSASVSAALAASCLQLWPAQARALDPDKDVTQYMVDFWRESNGLPQNNVKSILQTKNGYVWVGSKGGLARFDGVRFVTFDDRHPDQLREPEVWAVVEAENGSLWVGTHGGGLAHWQAGKLTTYTTNDGLPTDFVSALALEADGTLWIGTEKGLARFKAGRFTSFSTDDGLPNNTVRALHLDKDGTLWIGTWGGLCSYTSGRFVCYAARFKGQLDKRITAIAGALNDGLWVGTADSLLRVMGGNVAAFGTREGLPSSTINALELDAQDTLWIGTASGLCRYRHGRFSCFFSEVATLSSASRVLETVGLREVQAIRPDREGGLWVGTAADGLARLRDSVFVNITGRDGLPDNGVRCVFQDSQRATWFGTARGLTRIKDGVAKVYSAANSPVKIGVETLFEDREGALWIGMTKGVLRLVGETFTTPAPEPLRTLRFEAILTDASGNLWFGSEQNGLFGYRGGQLTNLTSRDGLVGDQVRGMALDSRGGLWISTKDGGVTCLRDGRFLPYTTKEGLAANSAYALYVDRDDTVWVATRRALCRIRNNTVATLTAQDALPANLFYQIIEDDQGYLWLAYGRGLARVAKRELNDVADGKAKSVSCTLYGAEQGLRSTSLPIGVQPGVWKSRDGRLWFATARGVAVVDPANMPTNRQPPPVIVEEVRAGHEISEYRSQASFASSAGDVEIHYTGLSFVAPDRVRFEYKLEGYDRDWVHAGARRTAYYTNLPPREYTFRVIAVNNDGVRSEREATLSLRVLPRWYQTWWCHVLEGLLACGLLAGLYLWRVAAFEQRQRDLARRVEERTRDLQQEVSDHKRTEGKLHDQITVRERAEEEARGFAEKLASSNTELTEKQRELEMENRERRRAEQTAGYERDLLHSLMDNTPDLIYFKDTEGRYTRVNKAHAEALGIARPEDAAGKSDLDFYPAEFARQAHGEEKEILAQGRPLLGKVEHDTRHGRWYLATKVPLKDKQGRVTGLVGISKDITERKLAEEKLERDLEAFLGVVKAVAQGDLTRRGATGEDTLGRIALSVNQMINGFASLLTEARDAAFAVSTASTEILAAATQIAKGDQYGRDQAQATTSAVEEMTVSMAQVSRDAEQSATAARQMLDHVRQGEQSVDAAALGMTRIDTAVTGTAERMRFLEQRSGEIFEIIGLIDEIASQSTLLSLNAAIEAAHAGEAGRGFGVVADEIRRLANRSTEATKSVTTIVEGIVDETRAVLAAMENAMREVKAGSELSRVAQGSLQEIQGLAQTATQLSEQIWQASREQAKAAPMVSQAMQTIVSVTQESSAGAQETSRAVRDLVDLSEQLSRAIARFRIESAETHKPGG